MKNYFKVFLRKGKSLLLVKFFLFGIFVCFQLSALAQERTISGTVTGTDGEPIPGATVIVRGTTIGALTDLDGNYSFAIPPTAQFLVVSFVGFITQEIAIDDRTVYNFVLREDFIGLEEVVVVGYGTQRRVSVTGAIVSVDSEELVKSPSAAVSHSLAGRVTGLTTVQYSGLPGQDEPMIFIRGIGTLSSGRSAPIMLVDGVERSFNQLDPNEIQSITILKDASATAVYGIRGANGVILVTTKRGTEGVPSINFSSSYGVQVPSRLVEGVDSYTYAISHNRAALSDNPNAGLRFPDNIVESFRTNSDPLIFPNTNWIDFLIRDYAPQSQHNFNISGGTEHVRYFVSLGAFTQDDLLEDFDAEHNYTWKFNRYNVRSNIDVDMTKSTTLSLSLNLRNEQRQQPGGFSEIVSPFEVLRWAVPFSGLLYDDGEELKRIRIRTNYISGPEATAKDGLDAIGYRSGYQRNSRSTIHADIGITQKLDFITEGLDWRFKLANNNTADLNKTRSIGYPSYDPFFLTDVDPNAPGDSTIVFRKFGEVGILGYGESSSKSRNWYAETALSYDRSFGNHNVTGLLLYNQSKIHYPSQLSDIPTGYVGMAARATYDYRRKYQVDFNLGYNGSENFAEGKRFGFFPAYGVGWVVSEENFFRIPESWISYLKFRVSYGVVGNDNIGGARFLYIPDSYNVNANPLQRYLRGYNFGINSDSYTFLASEGRIGNPIVTWEKAQKQNYGVDFRFFGQKLGISLDYFYEYRKDILTTRQTVPALLAIDLPAVNIGRVENQGYEVELNWRNSINRFDYYMTATLSHARNKILYMDEVPKNVEWREQTGRSVGARFAYVFDGFWSEEDAANYQDFPDHNYIPKPGDVRYKDLDGNGAIDADDMRVVGYPDYPEYIGSFSGGFSYRGFDVSMLWTGITNVSRQMSSLYQVAFGPLGDRGLVKYLAENAWTPETAETATLPRLTFTGTTNNTRPSAVWIYDASYIRLKNLEIGYRFSAPIMERVGISSLRFSANGYNLLTFDKMKISDPEARGTPDYPLIKIFNFGIQARF